MEKEKGEDKIKLEKRVAAYEELEAPIKNLGVENLREIIKALQNSSEDLDIPKDNKDVNQIFDTVKKYGNDVVIMVINQYIIKAE